MWHPGFRFLPVLAAVVACRTPARPARDAAARPPSTPRDAALDAPVDERDASVVRHLRLPDGGTLARLDAGRPRARPTRTAPSIASGGGRGTVIATPTGALWVRAINHASDRFADVVATALDPDGRPLGEPRLLRRTTGGVTALSASVAGPHLWVSWIALRATTADEERGPYELLSVALRASADLAAVDAPITLEDARIWTIDTERLGSEWWQPVVTRAFARLDGGALIVATGGVERVVMEHGTVIHPDIWTEFRVEPDGALTKATKSMFEPVLYPNGFVELPNGVFYAMTDGMDLRGSGLNWAPFSRGATAAVPTPDLHSQAGITIAWTGAGFAARGQIANNYGDGDEVAMGENFALFDERAALRTPITANPQHLATPDGEVAWTRYTLAPLRCVGGHPVATVRWRAGGGGTLTLDPTRPEQRFALEEWIPESSLPLPALADGGRRYPSTPDHLVWAGNALVGLVDGELARWTCGHAGRVALAP